MPFGNRYSGVPYVAWGWLGVQLFFLFSGFVIFMTLKKSVSFRDFLSRHWLRLFPAMLLSALLNFVSAPLFHERPAGIRSPRDLLPGLTFIDPTWWNLFSDSPQGVPEWAFLSPLVEIKFQWITAKFYFAIVCGRMITISVELFLLARLSNLAR